MPASSVRFRFRPPWWGVLLAAAGCAAGIALGAWQQGRAAEKRAAALNVPRVALRGALLERFTVYLDNRLYRGRPGYQVVQPLRTPDGRHVLVNRGWMAAGARPGEPPRARTPAGEVAIEGVRRERIARALEPPGAKREGAVWQNASVPEFAAWSGLALEPWVLEQHSALEDGLARDWPAEDAGAGKNEAYALQWYSLAALCVVLFLALNFKRAKPGS